MVNSNLEVPSASPFSSRPLTGCQSPAGMLIILVKTVINTINNSMAKSIADTRAGANHSQTPPNHGPHGGKSARSRGEPSVVERALYGSVRPYM